MIGVAFEPAGTNPLPGIEGVLWVDERTAELRHVEYQYTKLPGNVQSREVGGRIEFTKTPTGIWMVQRWRIRMPVVQIPKAVFRRQGDLGLETSLGNPTVVGFRDEGGEVVEILGPSGRTFAAREGRIRGIVYDSTRSRALAGAEVALMGTAFVTATRDDGTFEIAGVPEGEFTLTFFHPRLDTLGLILPGIDVSVRADEVTRTVAAVPSIGTLVSVLCPGVQSGGFGAVTGIVRDDRGNPVAGAAITASWTGRWTGDARTVLQTTMREGSTLSEPDGRYRLCGIPLDEIVELTAAAPDGPNGRLRFPPGRSEALLVADVRIRGSTGRTVTSMRAVPDARATITPERVSLRTEPGTGIVRGSVMDENQNPIEAAQVRIVGTGSVVRTMSTGTFSFALPTGSHVIDVRRLGYAGAVRCRRTERSGCDRFHPARARGPATGVHSDRGRARHIRGCRAGIQRAQTAAERNLRGSAADRSGASGAVDGFTEGSARHPAPANEVAYGRQLCPADAPSGEPRRALPDELLR